MIALDQPPFWPVPYAGFLYTIDIPSSNYLFTNAGVFVSSEGATIDWGDGTEPTPIMIAYETHTYSNPGRYHIKIDGLVYEFVADGLIELYSIDSPLPKYDRLKRLDMTTFRNCTHLTKVHPKLLKYKTLTTSFREFFKNCSSLEAIPKGLFNGLTEIEYFGSCFDGCSSITEIPLYWLSFTQYHIISAPMITTLP